jgi:hypothetical protein
MFSGLWGTALWFGLSSALPAGALLASLVVVNRGLGLCHSWSTTYMVVASPLLREKRRLDLLRTRVVPLLIFVGSLLLGIAVSYTVGGAPRVVSPPHPGCGCCIWHHFGLAISTTSEIKISVSFQCTVPGQGRRPRVRARPIACSPLP